MKKLISFAVCVLLSGVASAADDSPAVAGLLEGARELGRTNGLALACGYAEVSNKARALMVLRAPKTRRFGEAFEDASTAAFNEQTARAAACPEAVVLNLKLEMTEVRMQEISAQAEQR